MDADSLGVTWRWWCPRVADPVRTGGAWITHKAALVELPWRAVDPAYLGLSGQDRTPSTPLRPLVGGHAHEDAGADRFDQRGRRLDWRIRAELVVADPLPIYRQMAASALTSALVAGMQRAAGTPQEGDMAELAAAVDAFRSMDPWPGDDAPWGDKVEWWSQLSEARSGAWLAGYSWWRNDAAGWLGRLASAVESYVETRGLPFPDTYETFVRASAGQEIDWMDRVSYDRLFLIVAQSWRQVYEQERANA